MKFRVLLERPAANQSTINVFLIRGIWNAPPIRMLVREWEIEAKSEAQVRRWLTLAHKADAPNVRGFHLRSIEPITVETGGNHGK